MTVHGQCIQTDAYKTKINEDCSNLACLLCHKFDETVPHIVTVCPVLAEKEYIIRHDRLEQYINLHVQTVILHFRIHMWSYST